MHVIATAGHVDHGKSTLVRELTGMEPDRLREERVRGRSISLGYCWTHWHDVGEVAFVDVPGHERYLPTTLMGLGPSSCVLFAVAADDPWMPQAQEHLDILHALGVEHAVVAITRCDRADPGPAIRRTRAALDGTTLADAPTVPVSIDDRDSLDALRNQLARMCSRVRRPAADADVRLWIDRAFTMPGAGPVATGTLQAGTVSTGDKLDLAGGQVRVRGIEQLGQPVTRAHAPGRVAVNLAGPDAEKARPGSALTAPEAWHYTTLLDARISTGPQATPPRAVMLHLGSAAVTVRLRRLGPGIVRLTATQPLPLRCGDRGVIRDPNTRGLWGIVVLDPYPPKLSRRGDAAARAAQLADAPERPTLDHELDLRGRLHTGLARRLGITCEPEESVVTAGDLLLSRGERRRLLDEAERLVLAQSDPALGVPMASVAQHLSLTRQAVRDLMRPPLLIDDGFVHHAEHRRTAPSYADPLHDLKAHLDETNAFTAPRELLRSFGLTGIRLQHAVRDHVLIELAPGHWTLYTAIQLAHQALHDLRAPFTASEARIRLGISRRETIQLLEHLDGRGWTIRLPDDRRRLTERIHQTN